MRVGTSSASGNVRNNFSECQELGLLRCRDGPAQCAKPAEGPIRVPTNFPWFSGQSFFHLRNMTNACERSRDPNGVRAKGAGHAARARALLVNSGMNAMLEWLWPLIIFVAYFVLMRWVLPRFGVQT